MFEDPGSKIKTFAKVVFWIIMCSAILGFFIVAVIFADNSEAALGIFIGLGIIAGGAVLAYLNGLFLYAFGELVENSGKLVKEGEEIQKNGISGASRQVQPQPAPVPGKELPKL